MSSQPASHVPAGSKFMHAEKCGIRSRRCRRKLFAAAAQLTAVMDKHTTSGKPVLPLKLSYDLAGRLTD